MPLSRRDFLRTTATAAAALAVPGALELVRARVARGASLAAEGYGPLVPDPAGLLDLPKDFHYVTFSTSRRGTTDDPRFSQRMSNGEFVPCAHDGMAAFPGIASLTVLVRNHEVELGWTPRVDEARVRPYDPKGGGGTTTLWVNGDRRLVRSFPSLSGTVCNCAGGPTPWGTWLSAEECTHMPGAADPVNADLTPLVSRPHGYVFEVDSRAESLVDPVPIRAMGRFAHEALAVDPRTGYAYLTEDREDGVLYRYRPEVVEKGGKHPSELAAGDLAVGGALEALRIVERPSADTGNHDSPAFAIRRSWAVDWVAIPKVEPETDMERDDSDPEPDPLKRRGRTAPGSTRAQAFERGAARFSRTEGITYHRGAMHFCCTDGGPVRQGQVWRLDLARQRLTLVVESEAHELLSMPDNLCPAPNGDLIVCEDTEGTDRLRGLTSSGRIYGLARNAYNDEEFAGATFAPDGRTLFVNIQEPGITFAIWGPWAHRRG